MPNCQIVNREAAPWWFHIKRRHPFVTARRLLVIFTSIRTVRYGQVGLSLSTFNFPFIFCDCFIYLSFLVVFKDACFKDTFYSLTFSWIVISKLRVEKETKRKGKEEKKKEQRVYSFREQKKKYIQFRKTSNLWLYRTALLDKIKNFMNIPFYPWRLHHLYQLLSASKGLDNSWLEMWPHSNTTARKGQPGS